MAYWAVVRCPEGHLFETPWLPNVSFRSVRLGTSRLQRCPVGGHWVKVCVVPDAELSDAERQEARRHRTTAVP